MSDKTVRITVNGMVAEVPENALVLEACELLGITVPHFCYHKRLEPIAACRLCLVEIEGMPGLQPSCATRVKDGMIVRTDTSESLESHKEVLDLVLEEHPLDCHKCEAAGRCQLEDFTYEFGPHRVSYYHPPGVSGYDYDEIPWSPHLKFDPYKCVECTRCIRVCGEVQDCAALSSEFRGHRWMVTTFANGPLHCDFCGSCADVCPTGAIEQQAGKFWKKDWEMDRRPVVCAHCGHGCVLVARTFEGKIARIETDLALGATRANICAKGRFGWDIGTAASRLTRPMVRRDGALVEVSYEEAFTRALQLVKESARVAGLGSGMLSIEDLHALATLVGARGGKLYSESRDGELVRLAAARTGVYGSTHLFADAPSFDAVMLVDVGDEIDELMRIELLALHRPKKLLGAGRVSERMKPHLQHASALSPDSIVAAGEKCLFVVDAERVGADILAAVLESVEKRSSGVIFIAAQSNSRSLGALGFAPLPDALDADLVIVAGPQHLDAPPSRGAKLIVAAPFRGGLAESAEVLFPAALPYEKPGSYVNSEGVCAHSPAAAAAPEAARPDAAIWAALANECGAEIPATPEELRDACRKAHPELFERGAAMPRDKKSAPIASFAPPRLPLFPRHHGILLEQSAWLRKLREHLEETKEFAPWS